jgi:hypothetical protein
MDIDSRKKDIIERNRDENTFINHRMTWLGSFQGFLFAAVAVSWDKTGTKPLIIIICIIGMVVSASICYGIHRANIAIDNNTAKWDMIKPRPIDITDIDSEGYRSGGGAAWFMPGKIIPFSLIAAWFFVFILTLQDLITKYYDHKNTKIDITLILQYFYFY